ncbi:MAG: RNB domain-containing ribonuclease [Nitrospinae bacterium]|nr:RNB domain-containing ribonuclease [Nitrospinota bacterium]
MAAPSKTDPKARWRGTVVEFFADKKLMVGVCLEAKGERFLVLTEGDRELSLPESRFLHVAPQALRPENGRDRLVEALRRIALRREQLRARIDLSAVWELIWAEPAPYACSFLAGLVFDEEITPDHTAAMFRACAEDTVHFSRKGEMFVPTPPEMVEQLLHQKARKEEREREIKAAAEFVKAVWEEDLPTPTDVAAQGTCIEVLKEYALYETEAPRYRLARDILSRAGITAPDAPFQMLVRLGIWDEDENLLLQRLSLPTDFRPEVLEEAAYAAREVVELSAHVSEQRTDLTHLHTVTIDSELTRDFDDALSCEVRDGLLVLGVHIADPARVILPDSLLDQEARTRGTSMYLPEGKIPMLPALLSEGALSLMAGEVRLAMSVLVTLTPAAEILDFQVTPSIIHVAERLTYAEADARIGSDPRLTQQFETALRLREARFSHGAITLPIPQVELFVEPDKCITIRTVDREAPSQILVSELMILANSLVAQFCTQQHIPIVYRGQAAPRETLPSSPTYEPVLHYRQQRSMSPAKIGLEPMRHSSLGVEVYTTFTSPLRRYVDLLSHRQLRAYLQQGEPLYKEEQLRGLLAEIEPSLSHVGMVEQERRRYWLFKYLAQRKGDVLPGVILDRFPRNYRVLLPEVMQEVDLPVGGKELLPGDRVQVRIETVHPREGVLKISLA